MRKAAKVAVKQWSHANFYIRDLGRNNLLKKTNPPFLFLLKRSKISRRTNMASFSVTVFLRKWFERSGMERH